MTNQQKGFTLVELAIVITIIGLLIGGILKGQQLITNARVTATVNQINAYTAAAVTFYDSYGALPGDMNGVGKIPGCTTAALCTTPAATAQDGRIGQVAWAMAAPQQGSASTVDGEALLFWYYMHATGMINGLTATAPQAAAVWGVTNPAAKVGGGFIAGYSDGTKLGIRSANAVTIVGNVFGLVQSATAADTTATGMAMVPAVAAQIDRKVDDGNPTAGNVQATSTGAQCTVDAAGTGGGTFANTDVGYKELVTTKVCDLFVKFGG